jgi:hypothetical protein
MLSNLEYAKIHNVPEVFSPLMDEMALFTVVVPLAGKPSVDLWKVKKLSKKNEKKIAKVIDSAQRAMNLANYIANGTPLEWEDDGPQEEECDHLIGSDPYPHS